MVTLGKVHDWSEIERTMVVQGSPSQGSRQRFEWELSDEALQALVDIIPHPDDTPRDTWIAVLHGIAGAGGTFEMFDSYASRWVSYDAADTQRAWDTLVIANVKSGGGVLRKMAEEMNPSGFEAWRRKYELPGAFADPVDNLGITDEVLALQRDVANLIVRLHGDRIRWNVSSDRWHRFDKTWTESPHPLGYRLAKRWADGAAGQLGTAARAAVSKSAFYEGVEKILRADEKLAVVKTDFDKDAWLLGTPGGTVDLKTGVKRDAVASEMISLSTSVAPADDEACPQWKKFMDWVCTDPATGKVDGGMLRTLKQWAGYNLTGDVTQEMVAFLHGGGSNGKGTYIETLQAVLGSYFYMADKDLFMEGKFKTHTEEIAALAGKRMVAADEVPTNAKWNESLLKGVSGGGVMTTRHLYGRMFSFPIRFKVTVIGNEKPTFQGAINEALKRRLHLVEFRMTAKPRDPALKGVLAAEAPGVLRWMINGLLDMQKEPGGKLFVADSVNTATDEYFNENDLFGRWVSECVLAAPGSSATASDALKSWHDYRGMAGGGQLFNRANEFKAEMERRGYVWRSTKNANVINDITLKSAAFVF